MNSLTEFEKKDLMNELLLIKKGVSLVEKCERHPSYMMELRCVEQIVDHAIEKVSTTN